MALKPLRSGSTNIRGPRSACAFLLTAVTLIIIPAMSVASIRAELAADGLNEPVFVTAPTGDPRLFIVERAGVVRLLVDDTILPTAFLDISALVSTEDSFGCFGLAFAPDYTTSGQLYIYYTSLAAESVVARYRVSADPAVADPGSAEIVISIPQTATDHNGGTIAFRPTDGYLYLAPGDGGSGPFDPLEMGQNPQELLGKMLRIDVSGGVGTTYTVPASNPWVGDAGTLDEIWAFGLRNPFRWSFDRLTGDLWIADVGQEVLEEIDLELAGDPGGHNYGWDVMEGTACVINDPAPFPPCNHETLTLPFFEYTHTGPPQCSGSVTGGYVYRGNDAAEIYGLYVFADFCTAEIWTLDPVSMTRSERTTALSPAIGGQTIDLIVGFGEDGSGGLYVVDLDGEIFRIRSDGVAVPAGSRWGMFSLMCLIAGFGARLASRGRSVRLAASASTDDDIPVD